MLKGLRNAFDKHVLPYLPHRTQRDIADLRDLRKAPAEVIVDTQAELEQMLNASPIGQAMLNQLLNDRKKHCGCITRSDGKIVEITDERQDHLEPISPTAIRVLAATSLMTSITIAGGVRIRFTPTR